MSEWVERFRKEGAAADLDDLGVEVDDDFDHLEPEEAEQLARKLKPVQQRRFLSLYGDTNQSQSRTANGSAPKCRR